MVDQVITKQELIDAQKDAQTLEDVINGAADTQVTARMGHTFWTLATLNSKLNSVETAATQAIASMNSKVASVETARVSAESQMNVKVASVEATRVNSISAMNSKVASVEQIFDDKLSEWDDEAQTEINEWRSAISLITQEYGVPASAVSTAVGENQQDVNDYNGAKWRNKAGGYDLNARVVLENGNIVKSTVANNTNNPNSDMAGWESTSSASYIKDSKGYSAQDIFNGTYGDLNVLSVFTKAEYDAYILLGEEYDATIPVQRAIDRVASENKRLFFPKLFNVFYPLVLPEHVSFYGQGLTKNQTRRFSGIRSRAAVMFQAHPDNSTYLGYKQVRFNCSGMFIYGNNSIGFDQITLFGSEIFDNFIYNFDTFINGKIAGVTHIHHNAITFITNHVLADLQNPTASTMVDSYIHDNYLNAKATGTAVLLSIGGSSHFGISNNFFDFAYQCIRGTTPTAGTIHGNIFDVSYRGIRLDSGSSVSISSNNFSKNFKASASEFNLLVGSPNKTLLETTDWKGIEIKSLQSSSIVGNSGDSETLIDISGFSIKGVRTLGNTNKLISGKTIVISLEKGASLPDDLSGLRFEELEYRTVTTLPTPEAVVGGAPVATYSGDIVVYNKQVLRNNGTAWRSLDDLGRVVFNGDQTIFFAAIDPSDVLVKEVTLSGLQVGAIVVVRPVTQIAGSEYWAECNEVGKYNIYVRNNSNTTMSASNRSIKVYAQNP